MEARELQRSICHIPRSFNQAIDVQSAKGTTVYLSVEMKTAANLVRDDISDASVVTSNVDRKLRHRQPQLDVAYTAHPGYTASPLLLLISDVSIPLCRFLYDIDTTLTKSRDIDY